MNRPVLIAFADEASSRLDKEIAAVLRSGMEKLEREDQARPTAPYACESPARRRVERLGGGDFA